MGFLDVFKKRPLDAEIKEYDKIVEKYEKIRKKGHPAKGELNEILERLYYLFLIFSAFGRKHLAVRCLSGMRLINPHGWMVGHGFLNELLPVGYKRFPDFLAGLEPTVWKILEQMTADAEQKLKQPGLKAEEREALETQIKISRSGQTIVYPDKGREDLTAQEPPHKRYKSYCKNLCDKILETEYINRDAAKALSKYLMDHPIEAHDALKRIKQIRDKEITIDEKNKVLEKARIGRWTVVDWYKQLLSEKNENLKYNEPNMNSKYPEMSTSSYTRLMIFASYYFLLMERFDLFEKALKEVAEGSEKYGIKKKEWYEMLKKYNKELADEKTSYVYEWMMLKLLKVLSKKRKRDVVELDDKNNIIRVIDADEIEQVSYHEMEGTPGAKPLTKELDRAIGPNTPLHETEYKQFVKELQEEAERLYKSVNEKKAGEKGKLLAEYLLDFPMKAYEPVGALHTLRSGGMVLV